MATVGTVLWAEEKAIIGDLGYADVNIGGLMLYFQDPVDTIYPQVIIGQEYVIVDGSTCVRIKVANPWNVLPQANDEYAAKTLALLELHTLTVVPKAITDFGTLPGLT